MANGFVAKILTTLYSRFPSLSHRSGASVDPLKFYDTPWAPLTKPLSESKLALVTTAGVHLASDTPFNMYDTAGDPTFRVVPSHTDVADITITHDYYDHKDADKDINIVFPVERVRELVADGTIGSLANRFYGFMGHIEEKYIDSLVNEHAKKVLEMMQEDGVDIALLTPG